MRRIVQRDAFAPTGERCGAPVEHMQRRKRVDEIGGETGAPFALQLLALRSQGSGVSPSTFSQRKNGAPMIVRSSLAA